MVCIIMAVAGFLFPYKAYSRSKLVATEARIEVISDAIAQFKSDTGRYPTDQEGLGALLKKPIDLKGWNGPYLKYLVLPVDMWGNEYVYKHPSRYGNKAYDLYSFGQNGQDDYGERDDVTNWKQVDYGYYDKYHQIKKVVPYVGLLLITIASVYLVLRRWKKNERRS